LMAAGAVRIWRRQLVARIDKRRVGACLAGILLLAGAASTIPTPEGWPLGTGFGGLFGDWTSGLIAGLASMPGLPFPHVITGLLCAIGGLLAVGWSFQVRPEDVKSAAQVARRAAVGSAAATQRAIGYVSEKTRRQDEEEEAPQHYERPAPRVSERPRPAPRPAPRAP